MFVAGFIGEPPTNFLNAEVRDHEGRLHFAIDGADIVFYPDEARAAAIRRDGLTHVVLGIRPQNLRLPNGEDAETITAEIDINEYLGEHSILSMRDGQVQFRAMVPPSVTAGEGETITLSYRSRDVMVFHPDTEDFIG
jgi:multiple sugar transport system ATP-binding protein